MDYPTAHALLRSRRDWLGTLAALAVDDDGNLRLARVPGPGDGQAVVAAGALPYAREASGIAAGPCNAVFVADTAHDQLIYIDGLCGATRVMPRQGVPGDLPGHFNAPRGLAVSRDGLLVADSGNDRLQQLAFPRLEAHLALHGLPAVAGVAVDSQSRVLVVDATGAHRLWPGGGADLAFDQALLAAGVLARPLFVAADATDAVLLANINNERTDAAAHRPLPADTELAQAIRVLARAQHDAVWPPNRSVTRSATCSTTSTRPPGQPARLRAADSAPSASARQAR